MDVYEIKSTKSHTTYTVKGEKDRAFLAVSGDMATNRKVMGEVDRIRRGGADFATAKWTANMLAKTF